MNRRDAILALPALFAAPFAAHAQTEKMYRVGWIFPGTPKTEVTRPESSVPSLAQELRALGYVEGKNLILDQVSADGHIERYPEIVAEVLRRKPDVIVVAGSQIAVVTKKATSTVPIVMGSVADPVKYGLVASLARPGGNFTGIASNVTSDTEAKRLVFLRELAPKLSRVSYLAAPWVWEGPFGEAARQGAEGLGIQLLHAEHWPTDLKATFANIVRQRPEALLIANAPEVYQQRQQIADFALKARLPAIYPWAEMVQSGGLISYGWNIGSLFRQIARYVDEILKGANPGDLPVEQPSVYELVINLKTAKSIGISFPPSILIRADRVIE